MRVLTHAEDESAGTGVAIATAAAAVADGADGVMIYFLVWKASWWRIIRELKKVVCALINGYGKQNKTNKHKTRTRSILSPIYFNNYLFQLN
jgi:hypothetical protein